MRAPSTLSRGALVLVLLAAVSACDAGAERGGTSATEPSGNEVVVLDGSGGAEAAYGGDLDRGLVRSKEGSHDGYVLFAPIQSGIIYLVDSRGEVVRQWRGGSAFNSPIYLRENGNLLFTRRLDGDGEVFHFAGIGGRLVEMTWDGETVWEYDFPDGLRQHHDIEPLPNGNVLAIVWDSVTPDEAVARGRNALHVSRQGLWPDAIVEIEPIHPRGGRIVWKWSSWDHLVQDVDPRFPDHGDPAVAVGRIDVNADHRERGPRSAEGHEDRNRRMESVGYLGADSAEDLPVEDGDAPTRRKNPDWTHVNSVAYSAVHDWVAMCTPVYNEVWVVDHATTAEEVRGSAGDLLYRWGNPRVHGMGGAEDTRLFGPHDARFIPAGYPGGGNVLVFNNGLDRPGEDYSSVEELVLPLADGSRIAREEGEPFGPSEPVWSFSREGFFSDFISGAERLPNGNTLVCAGPQGFVVEVTPEHELVWEYLNPFVGEIAMQLGEKSKGWSHRYALFRVTYVPADHPGLPGPLNADEQQ